MLRNINKKQFNLMFKTDMKTGNYIDHFVAARQNAQREPRKLNMRK